MNSGRSTNFASKANSEKSGFILVVVLWILAALAALASTYSVYVGNAALATRVDDDRLRIRNATSTGIELTALKLLSAPDDARPPQGVFTVRLAQSTIDIKFVSEAARVDLNAAPKAELAGLFTAVGVDPSAAATFADRIAGWRAKADIADQNREAEDYKEASYDYAPRQAPFQNVLELRLVLGIPPYVVERILPLVTVFSGSAQVDSRVAPPEVLSALPNAMPEPQRGPIVGAVQEQPDGQDQLNRPGPARAKAVARPNRSVRVQLQIRLNNGRSARAEVVILLLEGEDEPYRVLSWRDDNDGPI